MPRPNLIALVVVLAAACGGERPAGEDGRPTIVTTVAPITNIVRNVAGVHADVVGIIPEGTDSHTFQPRPSVQRTMTESDLIVLNGLHLEEPTLDMAERSGTPIVELGDRTVTRDEWIFDFSFPSDRGDPNPHLWMNPLHAARYAEIAASELGTIDPENAGAYTANAAAFAERITELDARISEAVATVPETQRKLLTYHDSFAYFAPRYGFTVIGAIQPSDFSEPSPRDVARTIEQIKEENVKAVFGSEVFPSPVLDRIAEETGVGFVTTLRDDDLPGGPDAPEHTYFGMMVEDVRTIVRALGGDPGALDGFPVGNTATWKTTS